MVIAVILVFNIKIASNKFKHDLFAYLIQYNQFQFLNAVAPGDRNNNKFNQVNNSFIFFSFLMPEPQIEEESKPPKIDQIIHEKKKLNSYEIDENSKEICTLKEAESFSLDLDSYNFDAFISKMRHESCRPVLENIKR